MHRTLCSGCTQSNTASHVVERRLSLQHNILCVYRMRVSQPVNLCVRAHDHVTVFIQNFVQCCQMCYFFRQIWLFLI